MKNNFKQREISFKYQLSDKTLFTIKKNMTVSNIELGDGVEPIENIHPPNNILPQHSDGFLIRSLPVNHFQPKLRLINGYLCYIQDQYPRYYINLKLSFDEYKNKFSSKTRSTIKRKVKNFEKTFKDSGGWKVYKDAQEIEEFYRLARTVSANTYQEKLLDAGLPDTSNFYQEMVGLAIKDMVRGYILFDGDKPISYLYCPIKNNVLLYSYLGYNPNYRKYSVGTVLQWYSLEDLFKENIFDIFDFSEGQSAHKSMFSTNHVNCANVYFIRQNISNVLLVMTHITINIFSELLGKLLDKLKLKSKVKKFIRFSLAT